MEIYDKGADSVEVLGAGTFFKGLWLPTDKTQRPKIRNDQVLEIRKAHQFCRDFNVLVTYGNLCDQYEKVVEHIEHLLLVYKHDSTRVEDKQKAIEYILKWFMARVQDKEVQAPRKARPKVKKVNLRPVVHLNVGVLSASHRETACGICVPLNRTNTQYHRVTCGTCRITIVYLDRVRTGIGGRAR